MPVQNDPGYFFMPNHIILVGASDRPYSLGERILSNLLSTPFQGTITPVNPRHHHIAGLPAYTSLNKIPGNADLVIAATAPDSYETLFKACRKKQLQHIILIQDWENLTPSQHHTADTAIKKHHGDQLNITVCNPAGIQLPSLGLNISTQNEYPAGYVAVLTGNTAVSNHIHTILQNIRQGISRHISLNHNLSPLTSADWLNRFGHSRHTKAAVLQHNPNENQRSLFSAIRHFTRHTPLILHSTHHTTDTEKAILHSLARHCNFIPTFTPEQLDTALRAHLSDLPPVSRLTVLSDAPADWLTPLTPDNLTLHLPNQTGIHHGNIGSTPTPAHYHQTAQNQLTQTDTQALLTIITPSSHPDEKKLAKTLSQLAKHTKPHLISSRFSDGILHFNTPEQALQTLSLRNTIDTYRRQQQQPASANTQKHKTPQPQNITKALEARNPALLAEALCLPAYRPSRHNAVSIHFSRHPLYGDILTATAQGKTTAVLPPFDSTDSEHLNHFIQPDNPTPINQFLHTLNTLIQTQQHTGEITLNLNGSHYSTDLQIPHTPKTKHNKTTHTLEQAAAKMQTAAEYLRSKNPAAAEFLRNTGEAAAEFFGNKTTHTDNTQNVLPPYPQHPTGTLTLKNRQTVSIQPIHPEDAEAIQQFIRQLTPESRYTRFMTRTNELPANTLARLSRPDYHSEAAWSARHTDGSILAVSRYSRINRNECEFGITLAENMRRTGLAHEMMQLIIQSAIKQNYLIMSANILKTNTAMVKLAEKSGFTLYDSPEEKTIYRAVLKLQPDKTATKTNKNLHTDHKIT